MAEFDPLQIDVSFPRRLVGIAIALALPLPVSLIFKTLSLNYMLCITTIYFRKHQVFRFKSNGLEFTYTSMFHQFHRSASDAV